MIRYVTPAAILATLLIAQSARTQTIDVEAQPLADNALRLLKALDTFGHTFTPAQVAAIESAAKKQDIKKIQELLEPHVLIHVHLNPEARVKLKRGDGPAVIQQGGYTPVLIKVHNESTVTKPLRIGSPQALPIHSGGRAKGKGEITIDDVRNRFLDLEMVSAAPMTDKLSGLKLEYALALVYSRDAGVDKEGKLIEGKGAATIIIDVGQGTTDVGGRGEVPVLFTIKPGIPVKLMITDFDDTPTTGRFTFKDKMGRVYPPKAKRLAPDFFFQDQVYRHNGGVVLLPPGELTMTYGRGPEYRLQSKTITVPEKGDATVAVKLERWINPMTFGFYSGDHHIHAAGCSHYTNPTEGVFAEDMFLHVKGEGMNVGCNLTWGPCYDFQRQFFEPTAHKISEPFTVLKYDVEVSGFGSQALGHVCLLNLRDQTYPGSDGTKTKGWPTWTTPLMRWAKNQGAYTGYAHSASGLGINAEAAAERLLDRLGTIQENEQKIKVEMEVKMTVAVEEATKKRIEEQIRTELAELFKKDFDDKVKIEKAAKLRKEVDERIRQELSVKLKDEIEKKYKDAKERKSLRDAALVRSKFSEKKAESILLPLPFDEVDTNNDGFITTAELIEAHKKAANKLPNHAIPEMNGIGAQEICVTTAQGICDFISAMDTQRVPEWNCWYHLLNCGYPLKVSGETDFPCITDSRVGQGRVYVQLGTKIKKIDFKDWAEGLAKGRSYVSDGYAHALHFSVNDAVPGEKVKLREPGKVAVKAKVAFASEPSLGTAQGGQIPKGRTRQVELIVNGRVIATQEVAADDKEHDLTFTLPIEQSSWVALRHFPQMHTNPVDIIIADQPIRCSKESAMWCVDVIEQLWRVRGPGILPEERVEAERVFQWAVQRYRQIAEDAQKVEDRLKKAP
jgi:hypothetical protein